MHRGESGNIGLCGGGEGDHGTLSNRGISPSSSAKVISGLLPPSSPLAPPSSPACITLPSCRSPDAGIAHPWATSLFLSQQTKREKEDKQRKEKKNSARPHRRAKFDLSFDQRSWGADERREREGRARLIPDTSGERAATRTGPPVLAGNTPIGSSGPAGTGSARQARTAPAGRCELFAASVQSPEIVPNLPTEGNLLVRTRGYGEERSADGGDVCTPRRARWEQSWRHWPCHGLFHGRRDIKRPAAALTRAAMIRIVRRSGDLDVSSARVVRRARRSCQAHSSGLARV